MSIERRSILMPPVIAPPPHDRRVKGPAGLERAPKCFIVHTTQGNQREGPGDRHGVIDYIAGKGIAVPWVTDDDGITRMTPLGRLGDNHACGLDAHATGCEQVGMAQWGRKAWLRDHRETVRNTGRVLAFELAGTGKAVTLENLKAFAFGHVDDHKCSRDACSDHWDPGPGYPYDVLFQDSIEYARSFERPTDPKWAVEAARAETRQLRRFRRLKAALRYAEDRVRKGFRVVLGRPRLVGGELEG
jgi:hypothetical protein